MSAKGKLIRNIIIAVVVLAVLGGGYYFAVKWEPNKKEEAKTDSAMQPVNSESVVSVDATEVASIHIKNADSEYDIVKKNDGDNTEYEIAELIGKDVNKGSISSMFSSLLKVSAVRVITEDTSKTADFGLSAPSAFYIIRKTDGSNIKILIGDEVPTDSQYYCMAENGNKIYTISSYIASYVKQTPEGFRVTNILSIQDVSKIKDFKISDKVGTVLHTRSTTEEENKTKTLATAWTMEFPWQTELSDDKIAELYTSVSQIVAKGFAGNNAPNDYEFKLEIALDDNNYSFSVGGKTENGDTFLKDNKTNTVYIVAPEILKAISLINPNDYITKFVNIVNIQDISRVTLSANGKEMTLEPGNEDGKAYKINGEDIAEKEFKTKYQAIIGLLFKEFSPNSPNGEPILTITYDLNDGRQSITRLYEQSDRDYLAITDGKSPMAVLKSSVQTIIDMIK